MEHFEMFGLNDDLRQKSNLLYAMEHFSERVDDITPSRELETRQTRRGDSRTDGANGRGPGRAVYIGCVHGSHVVTGSVATLLLRDYQENNRDGDIHGTMKALNL
ncbi:hypothetical protein AJ78_05997 [Emergomyces pasteurianus Ep9510]|uniref:Uncharacterized protein n=1 Tax=Emergomyces pasteurianus Ep9510 TaxID=1447872 RepID=A0A1J9PAG9_9EURO|nr:hypothetical protein AJ78_05997 [Emergomyces pasteurianus Ep9510]